MKFQLKSEFSPSGDQPTAIKGLVNGLNEGEKHQAPNVSIWFCLFECIW